MTNSLASALNRANVGQMADGFRALRLGTLLTLCMPAWAFGAVPTVGLTGKPVTVDTIELPSDAKAQVIKYAYARTGTGTTGPLTIVAYGTVPSAGEIAVSPDGDIVTAAADAWTLVDVAYIPLYGELVEDLELDVSSNVATFPTRYAGKVLEVISATALEGTSTGRKQVLIPGASLSAGQCALAKDKNTLNFKNTDAVTSCKVSFIVYPTVNAHETLLAESPLV